MEVHGSLSFLIDGLPRISDPNVQVELMKIIFGSRAKELQSPLAMVYAKRIRFLLPMGLVLFAVGVAGGTVSAP